MARPQTCPAALAPPPGPPRPPAPPSVADFGDDAGKDGDPPFIERNTNYDFLTRTWRELLAMNWPEAATIRERAAGLMWLLIALTFYLSALNVAVAALGRWVGW